MDEVLVRQIVFEVLSRIAPPEQDKFAVPVEVSARHVHLSLEDARTLFGTDNPLTCKRELSQPGQFLSEQRVSIVTAKGQLHNVAVLGPVRSGTQVEISLTDSRALGIDAPVRQSGNTAGAATVYILSDHAMIQAKESAIVAQNHIHTNPIHAQELGLQDGQKVKVRMNTSRPILFDDVVVRLNEQFSYAMHIDFDEANACAFQTGNTGTLIL